MPSRAWKVGLAKRSFLVADDQSTLPMLVSNLKNMGVETIYSVTDGREALEILEDPGKQVDMVIYDWDLPALGGLEALQFVRQKFGRMPFLMLSKAVTRDSLAAAAKHRVDGYLAKPFSMRLLESRIVALTRALPYELEIGDRTEPLGQADTGSDDDIWSI